MRYTLALLTAVLGCALVVSPLVQAQSASEPIAGEACTDDTRESVGRGMGTGESNQFVSASGDAKSEAKSEACRRANQLLDDDIASYECPGDCVVDDMHEQRCEDPQDVGVRTMTCGHRGSPTYDELNAEYFFGQASDRFICVAHARTIVRVEIDCEVDDG